MVVLRQFDPEALNRVPLSYLPMLQQNDHPGSLFTVTVEPICPATEMTDWTLSDMQSLKPHRITSPQWNSTKSIPIDNHVTASWWWHGLLGPPMEFPLATSAVTSFRMTQVFQNQTDVSIDFCKSCTLKALFMSESLSSKRLSFIF